jgi:hypothetical protein
MHPFTKAIQEISTVIPEISGTRNVVLIDTPGFDYSKQNTEHDMFKRLADWTKKRWVKIQYGEHELNRRMVDMEKMLSWMVSFTCIISGTKSCMAGHRCSHLTLSRAYVELNGEGR